MKDSCSFWFINLITISITLNNKMKLQSNKSKLITADD